MKTGSFALIYIFFIFSLSGFSQIPTASIATFKNNAKGAYTIIHDDFGGQWAHGIEDHADSMAFNRNIPFTFAAITGECDAKDWQNAKTLISHGHQIVNHSMYHKCGKEVSWCTSGTWDERDFKTEIDKSTELIEKNSGKHPAFFMFPYDLHTDTMINYLKNNGFCGARSGSFGLNEITKSSSELFDLNFKPFPPNQTLEELNNFCLEAESKNVWAIREVHGVNDESWGSISLENYRSHLDFLKKQSEINLLWVATLSDVLHYTLWRQKITPSLILNEKTRKIQIEFISNEIKESIIDKVKWNRLLNTSKIKNLTLVVKNINYPVNQIKQLNLDLPFKIIKDEILMEIDPNLGPISILY